MDNPIVIITPIVALALLYVAVPVVADAYRRFRGPKTVTCPETNAPVEIRLDAFPAALTTLDGAPVLRVTNCSRWPEHRGCGQECVHQVAPEAVEA